MITIHIKRLELINGTWVIELKNSQIIKGTMNLAESIEMCEQYCWPQPELSCYTETELLRKVA